MRRVLLTLSCFMFAIVLSSCITRTYVIVEPSTISLKGYKFLEVRDFESALNEKTALDITERLPAMIVDELYGYNVANPGAQLLFPVRSTDETDQVLVIHGVLIGHEKKSRAQEPSGSSKKGKDSFLVKCTFSDKRTGQKILESQFEAKLAGGFLSKNVEETARDIAKAIVFYLEKHS